MTIGRSPLLISLLLVASAALSGCAATLKPATSAQLAGDSENAALARSEGVVLIVEPGDWNAFPRRLEQELTPLRATITNNSDRPLKIEYDNFALAAEQGVTYRPLPPIDIEGTVTQQSSYPVVTQRVPYPLVAPRFAHRGFWLAPYYHPYVVGIHPWRHSWAHDPLYYDRYYPRWQVNLPTRDMLELAIPEGVIEPKGQVSGFLYFPELDAVERGDQLSFTANLVDASTDAPFGDLTIPFQLE